MTEVMGRFVYGKDEKNFAERCTEIPRKRKKVPFISEIIVFGDYRATAISCQANFSRDRSIR